MTIEYPEINNDIWAENPQLEENEVIQKHQLDQQDIVDNTKMFIKNSFDKMIAFKCALFGNENLSRKIANEMFNEAVSILVEPLLQYLEKDLLSSLPKEDKINKNAIEILIKDYRSNMYSIKTEYNFMKILKNDYEVYTDPKEKVIRETISTIREANNLELVPVTYKICVPNIKFILKLFLELPCVLDEIIKYQDKLKNTDKLINIMNGELWKEISSKFDTNKIVIPFFLFTDDFVIDHHLSFRAQKTAICGFYITFPTLPPQYRSKIENILVAAAIKSRDIKTHGYSKCLTDFIEMLKDIEINGIELNTKDNETKLVHPVLLQIIGDNLGLNQILGYVSSFTAHHYCRHCLSHKDDMRKQYVEIPEKLRTAETYAQHIENIDPTNTGIKSGCAFNELPTFKAYNNAIVDVQHDLFEGICKLILPKVKIMNQFIFIKTYSFFFFFFFFNKQILKYFIEEKKYISLDHFNELREMFESEPDKKNFNDVTITSNHLKNNDIPMTASEIRSFLLHLPLILDSFVPDKNDYCWQLLITLVEIVEIVLLPEFDDEILDRLEKLIKKHHKLYVEKCKFGHLTPKLHFLIHYVRVIRKLGPPVHYMAMRGESKHQWLKHMAQSTASRLNPAKTLCIKDSFSMAHRTINKKGLYLNYYEGKSNPNNDIWNNFSNLLTTQNIGQEDIFEVGILQLNGITYKKNFIICEVDRFGNKFFLDIIHILKIENSCEYWFICSQTHNYDFDPSIRAYRVKDELNCNNRNYELIKPFEVKYEPVIRIDLPCGQKAIKLLRKLEFI